MALDPLLYGHIVPWYAQFLGINGTPLSGGHIEIFKTGTSEKYISYQNFDGSVNPFKVPLTTGGRCVAIGEIRFHYDVYVYNRFGGLEYSRLNVGVGDSEGVNLEFTSSDGSVIINRSGNTVDLRVRQDPNSYGEIGAEGTDSDGMIFFDTVAGGTITTSQGRLMIDEDKLYHLTLEMEFTASSVGYNYADCQIEDSEGGVHKFHLDESVSKQYVNLSWDILPTRNWLELSADIPASMRISDCVVYMHRVNPIAGGGGGGGGETYTAGEGININAFNVISTDMSVVQPKLTAGSNIVIDQSTNTISATATPITVDSALSTTSTNPVQNKVITTALNTKANSSSLATVATTGSYNDLLDKPIIPGQVQADWTESDASSPSFIEHKPTLATVATSGSYNDLSNKPTIPAAQVNSDWNAASGVSMILNKPNLATVATTGSYNDLTDKPTIPAIPVTDVQVNNTSVVVNGVANVDLTPYAQINSLATVATSGSYNDLSNKPDLSVFARSADLATVATTGDYDDLTNKPSIPAAQVNSDWNASSGVAEILNKPANLVQDANYVHTDNNFTTTLKDKLDGIATGAEVNVQANWNETNSSSDAYIQNKPQNLVQDASYVHTDNNFTTALKDKLDGIAAGAEVNVQADYAQSDSSADDYIKNKPDLSVYAQIADLAAVAFSGDYDDLTDTPDLSVFARSADLAAIATSGSWNDLSNVPSDLVQDASYVHTDNNFTTALKDKLDGIEAGAEVNVQANWTQTDNTADDYIKNKPGNATTSTDGFMSSTDKAKLDGIAAGAEVNVQSNWTESDSSSDAYIQNKPGNATTSTDGFMSSTDKTKLDGIAAGAEVNVQADWTETNTSSDAYIQNKPVLAAIATSGSWNDLSNVPTDLVYDASYVHTDNNFTSVLKNKLEGIEAGAEVNVQSDWTQTDATADDFIKHKPDTSSLIAGTGIVVTEDNSGTIISMDSGLINGVQSNWNESDSSKLSYIQNKPSIPVITTTTV